MRIIIFVCLTFLVVTGIKSQIGPNSPASATNNVVTGSVAWTSPGNCLTSNDVYASVATKGITNYIAATNFGFAISIPSSISGIQLEVERSTNTPTAVAVLNNWSNGFTKIISAGVARCLVAAVFMENGLGSRDVTAMTYGGQSLTQITQASLGGAGFSGKIEYWCLMESGISSATSTAFSLTYDATALDQNWEAVSSAVYQFVDQVIPSSNTAALMSNSATNPITLSPALSTFQGGMSISGVFCGNNTTPADAVDGTNTYLINSGFTEAIDTYSANSGFATSGGAFQIATKATVTSGTEAPTYTFAGTANRQVACCIHLQRSRECDQSVRLIKAGTIVGSDLAQTTSAWTTTDTYAVYGGAANLWGTTWTDAQINATNFGAVFSASVQNGTARVDHLRITIYSFSTLPIELLDFSGYANQDKNELRWRTATEKNNKQFELERMGQDFNFQKIGTVKGNGNSQALNNYVFTDEMPLKGLNYYRLKQVDEDGTFKYYKIISILNSLESDELIVYPNPNSDGNITITGAAKGPKTIRIYNELLQLIQTIDSDKTELSFSLEQLLEGTYYLILDSEKGQQIKRLQKTCR